MASVLVDVILERLANLALDQAEKELKLLVGVKKEIQSLTLKLEAIQAVLEDAEQRQVMEAGVRRWLDELNDVSFDMDDLLDEWLTSALVHVTSKKVCLSLPSSCFCFGQGSQLCLRHEIARKITELNERLAMIDERKQNFSFQSTTRPFPEPSQVRPKTTSLLDITFGRGEEKKLILGKLLSESSEGKRVPLIIPIIGMGGLGKTTLAQLAYNDELVKSHFDKRIWVCVSDPFEEIKIAQAIIEGLDKHNTLKNSYNLQTLMQCIYELLEGKKFLLVLDDVWSPKSSQLEELMKPLRNGAIGSRVLVTTRKEEVATLMKATTEVIHMERLNEAFCLSLFYYNAHMDESSVSREFSDIGLELVKRCKGLPLAVKTLGSLMRNKKNIHEWQAVLKSKTWELKEIQQDVFRPLLLSYHDLTIATKHCLLYCITFPKDHVYDKTNLIELWMSQDFLNARGSKERTIVGQTYFDDLVTRSFFQDIKIEYEGAYISFKIHDIIHDFLQYLTKNECLILDAKQGDSERKEAPNDKVHHLTLVYALESLKSLSFLLHFRKLHTFRVMSPPYQYMSPCPLELTVRLKCLRTITLVGPSSLVKVPKTIGGLIHLRYLDLSCNELLRELPSTMNRLYNLQTLKLNRCGSLKRLDVRRMTNLRHLYVGRCYSLNFIKGLERLTDLQRLNEFRVTWTGERGNKLAHLKNLLQLQGSISIYDHYSGERALEMVIKYPLQWSLNFTGGSSETDGIIMSWLEPHPSLDSLEINSYYGSVLSPWLCSLDSLRVLCIRYAPNCRVLPPLGKLPNLELLDIRKVTGNMGGEFLGIQGKTSDSNIISFPKLKQLCLSRSGWGLWEAMEANKNNITIMPCLSELTIHGWYGLEPLPDFLWKTPLQKLKISESPGLEKLYKEETGVEWHKISHIPTIDFSDDPLL